MEREEFREEVWSLLNEGISMIPANVKKKPIGAWKDLQTRRMEKSEMKRRFNGATRCAVVSGEVSGNLECLDIDDVKCREPLINMISAKHSDILDNLVFTKTPNGFGIVYRCEEPVGGNKKIAMAWKEVEGEGDWGWNNRMTYSSEVGDYVEKKYTSKEVDGKWYISPCRLETRGEGGYFLFQPSPGYEIMEGSVDNMRPISIEDRNSILTIARSFDQRPEKFKKVDTGKKETITKLRIPYPGDVYNERVDYEKLLESYSWRRLEDTAAGITFVRPGKREGVGGILYPDGKFHVFSQSVHDLDAEGQYTAYAMRSIVEFDSDFSACAKKLSEEGYVAAMTVEEVTEVLKDNPDQVDDAYKRSGLSEANISAILTGLGIPLPPGKHAGRKEILYDKLDLNGVLMECDEALSQVMGKWGYYTFSDRLGYVGGENTFVGYDKDTLELRCEQSFYMSQWTSKGAGKAALERIRVPEHVCRKLMNFPDTSAPTIKGFSKHPVVMKDGNVIGLQDGFERGIMFKGCNGFKVDDRPFKECYDRIVELFCTDILFKKQKIGQALFVSMMMTAVSRLGIEGGCPGFFITANEPGTGKSTMFEFVSRIVYGRQVESVDWGDDAVERRKEVVAYLREGQECFLFDNIKQGEEVKSPILAQAITAGEFKARVMGKGEMTYVPAQSLFVFIGNNIVMSTELARRLMTIELTAKQEDPASRKVSISDIRGYCDKVRVEAIGCLLKMVQEGVSMENEVKKSSGNSFWDKMVRNPILVETGLDIIEGFDTSKESSDETRQTSDIVRLLRDVFGTGFKFTTRLVFLAITDERYLDDFERKNAQKVKEGKEEICRELRDAMIMENAKSPVLLKSTGRVLSGLSDRVAGDFQFVRHKTRSKQPILHWVQYVGEGEIQDESV